MVIRGAKTGKVPAVVIDAYKTDVEWNGGWLQNVYEMEFTSSKETTRGDSGAPIIIDGKYLVGIYKGRKKVKNDYIAYGSKFGFVERWFDVELK